MATLCVEGEELIEKAFNSILPPLLLYGEDGDSAVSSSIHSSESAATDYPALRIMSAFLPFLVDVSMFLGRVSQVARCLLMQIHALHSLPNSTLAGAGHLNVYRCWRTLGDLLSVLIQADQVISSRPLIKLHWISYTKAIETAMHNPAQFGTTAAKLRPLLSCLMTIQSQIIAAESFRNCYQMSFGVLDDDKKFAERMRNTVLELLQRWEKAAATDVPDRRRLTSIVALTTFYQLHFATKDKKLLKAVWATHKKIVVYHLVGDLLWMPCLFLLREVPLTKEVAHKKTIEFVNTTNSLHEKQAENLVEEAYALVETTQEWTACFRLEMWQNRSRDAAESLRLADSILKGARLADSMNRLLKTFLNTKREGNDLLLSRSLLIKLFAVIQSIKSVSLSFSSHWQNVLEVCQLASQQWRCHMLSVLDEARAKLGEEKGKDGRAGVSLVAIQCAANALLSSACRSRLIFVSVALEFAVHNKVRSGGWSQLPSLLSRLETLSRPRRLVSRVTDCSFLLFHRHLFRLFAAHIVEEMPPMDDIRFMLLAANDGASLSRRSRSHFTTQPDGFLLEVIRGLREELIIPLCGKVENDLRVLTHPHLKVDDRDRTSQEEYRFLLCLLKSPPFRILDIVFSVKEEVEKYLERSFYNVTAVALHDCHTYSKMALLAHQRYGLSLIDGQLPYQTLNQGLDVINVMKGLSTFVTQYNYDLYHQYFVEKESKSRALQILSWEHMSNSLRTHGMGVVNTSVNCAYQLLRKKLGVISQFLDDEHVKALLVAEAKFWEENRKNLNKKYPVKRAERLGQEMAELGRIGDKATFFQSFKQTITQLGNALGFVRSMKSAAELVSSESLVYDCADDDWIESGEAESAREAEPVRAAPRITPEESRATEMLRSILKENRAQDTRNRQYIEGSPSYSTVHPGHPPPTRQASVAHNTKDLTFVDDGFVLGMAYLLTVIEGWEAFSSLNWFGSVLDNVVEERKKLTDLHRNEDITKTVALKLSKLEAQEKEWKLLSCSLQSARMLFMSEEKSEESEQTEYLE